MGIRYSYAIRSVTQTVLTTTLTNAAYLGAIGGNSSTQRLSFAEIYLGGEATASSTVMVETFSRVVTTAITAAGAAGGATVLMDGGGTVAGTLAISGNSFTTPPATAASSNILNLSFNAYGGIVRWVARPGEEPTTVANGAVGGGMCLYATTGAGSAPVSAHILFEIN